MSDYKHITDFLNKFRSILFDKEEVKTVIKDVVFNKTSFKLEDKDIIIKTPTVYINGSPVFKNEIFIQKEEILKELYNKIPSCKIKDIR